LSASQDIALTVEKTKCLFGFCDTYNDLIGMLATLYDPRLVIQDLSNLHPEWSDAQVIEKAIAYLTEAKKSLDASTFRTIVGTMDVVGAVTTALSATVVGIGSKAALLDELTANGVKFTAKDIVAIGRDANGKIVFLETGTPNAGLQHILERHAGDFANKGMSAAEIPSVVMKAVTEGKVVGTSGSANVYEVVVNGVKQYVAVGISSNGFIVRANPVSVWKPLS